jgi:hypothetical protein
MPPPKHYPWSDASLSPDLRADLVIKEMTLDEKISFLHGVGAHLFRPRRSDGCSDGTSANLSVVCDTSAYSAGNQMRTVINLAKILL